MGKLKKGAWYHTTVPMFCPFAGLVYIGDRFQLSDVREMSVWPGHVAGYVHTPFGELCVAFESDLENGHIVEVAHVRGLTTAIREEPES